MKLGALAIAALVGLVWPAVASADLIPPPEPTSKPASDPPPGDPGASDTSPEESPADGANPANDGSTAPAGDAPVDPTSSVQGPPKGGCASCRVGDPDGDGGALPLALALVAATLAWKRRR
jgi:MYXO-CTERM domain-containing protein